jgi:hypothetical protein
MSDKIEKSTKQEPPPTIITLTLPTPEGGGISLERATAMLLIQRGELAHLRQFHYNGQMADLIVAIREAHDALGLVEDNPPVIPNLPEEKPKPAPTTKAKAAQKPSGDEVDEEPTIDIPLKKGAKAVKISHLKIVGGETDAAAYRQAALIAGKLIDGKLWDGESPIRIDDVYAVEKRMKYLTDKDLSLFTLDDFVQVGAAADAAASAPEGSATQPEESETDSLPPVNPAALEGVIASSNGQRPDDETDPIALS